jgi:hypothetical protein
LHLFSGATVFEFSRGMADPTIFSPVKWVKFHLLPTFFRKNVPNLINIWNDYFWRRVVYKVKKLDIIIIAIHIEDPIFPCFKTTKSVAGFWMGESADTNQKKPNCWQGQKILCSGPVKPDIRVLRFHRKWLIGPFLFQWPQSNHLIRIAINRSALCKFTVDKKKDYEICDF